MKNLVLVLVIASGFWAETARADYIFSPALTYMTRDVNDSSTASEAQMTSIDARIGYTFDFGMYMGVLYSLAKERNSSAGYDSSDFLFGPTLGFNRWNAYALVTYHLFGERDMSAGGVKYAGGNGLQVDLGYVVPISETISLGPQLTYRNIDFADKETLGVAEDTSYKWNGVTPYISLWLNFN